MEREIGNFYIEGYNFDTKTYDSKENTLLLVIDLQEKLMPAIYESEKIVKKSSALLKVFDILVGLVGAPMAEARISTKVPISSTF